MSVQYQCCIHCRTDDPVHDVPQDTHGTWCSVPDCFDGKRVAATEKRSGVVL